MSAPSRDRALPGTGRVIAVRCLRSFTQSFLNVVTPLYLLAHGVSSAGLGALFAASFVIGAVFTAPIGFAADRLGRKPFLVAFTVLMALWGLLFATTTVVPVLLIASAIAGIGRGGGSIGGGQAGPFSPAEQALLADLVPSRARGRVFTLNAMLSALFAAAGSSAAGLPEWLRGTGVPLLGSDRLLFVLTVVLSAVSLALLVPVREPPRSARPKGQVLKRRSTRLVLLQSIAGSANAFGLGFVNSLFVVWVHLRYHVGATAIGPLLTASYLASAVSVWAATAAAGRIGSVRTIVLTRCAAVALTVGMALSPSYLLAAILQVLRSVAQMMATPVRQAFTMGLFTSNERASAAGLTGVARRASGAVSPAISGALMGAGSLEMPFFLAAGFQLVSALMFRRFFSGLDDRGARRPDRAAGPFGAQLAPVDPGESTWARPPGGDGTASPPS